MKTIEEGALLFEFEAMWLVEKFDEHNDYRRGVERLRERVDVIEKLGCRAELVEGIQQALSGDARLIEVGTKAVDMIGVLDGQLHLIEVKDFRGHSVENRKRLRDGDLACEVALKVRDTLAGLLGAFHQGEGPRQWHPYIQAIAQPDRPPHVTLWLEEDVLPNHPGRGHPSMPLADALKQRLAWLTRRVHVLNQTAPTTARGFRVRSIPDGVVQLRRQMRLTGRITRQDYCQAFRATPIQAGRALRELCGVGVLAQAKGDRDLFLRGPGWVGWFQP